MTIQAKILTPDWGPMRVDPLARLKVRGYEKHVLGGPRSADLSATGDKYAIWQLLEFLGRPVTLHDDLRGMTPVWWGLINEVSFRLENVSFAVSLDEVANAILVRYNYSQPGRGGPESFSAETTWAINDTSIAAFGRKERKLTLSDTTTQAAEHFRDTLARELGRPAGEMKFFTDKEPGGSRRGTATIRCIGVYETIDWLYYPQPAGLENFAGRGSKGFRVGLGVPNVNNIAFEPDTRSIVDFHTTPGDPSRWAYFDKGDMVRVSGTTLNNGDFTVDRADRDQAYVWTGNTVAFNNVTRFTSTQVGFTVAKNGRKFISDLAQNFGPFKTGDKITVTGPPLNTGRTFTIKSTADDGVMLASNTIQLVGGTNNWIRSSAINLLDYFDIGDTILVAGSTQGGQNRAWRIDDAGSGGGWYWLHVEGSLGTTVTGVTITLSRGHTIEIETAETLSDEDAGPSCTFDIFPYTDGDGDFHGPIYQIDDSLRSLDQFRENDLIFVSGAVNAGNNGYTRILRRGSEGAFFEVEKLLIDEAAGAAVTIIAGARMTVLEPINLEYPTVPSQITVKLIGTERIAQSFQQISPEPWTVDKIEIGLRKYGNPGNPFLYLVSDTAGNPGGVLETHEMDVALIFEDSNWYTVDAPNTTLINPNVTYWIQFVPYSLSPFNFYEIDVDTEAQATYPRGQSKKYDGVVWSVVSPATDMLFRVLGAWETTYQMRRIVEEAPFIETIDLPLSSGVQTPQYRDGMTTALRELEDLMELGTSQNRRIFANVDLQRGIAFTEEPPRPTEIGFVPDWTVNRRGEVFFRRQKVPLADCPVGFWIKLKDVIPATANLDRIIDPSLQFVESAYYNAEEDTYEPRTRASADAGNIGGTRRA